ncbi:MAG: LysR family transcriptional regulator [Spirochaetales bacterium]|nr:LysR family transcriptional regulator [Spirochaetales bacterium]
MKISQIQCFMEAAKCLNFTEAANNLKLSQPALSKQIASLEAEINVQLFLRMKKRVFLSEPGKVFLKGLKTISKDYEKLITDVNIANENATKTLTIGYLEDRSISPRCSEAISTLTEKYPDISVRVEQYKLRELLHKLEEKQVDICFTLEFDIDKYPNIAHKVMEKTKNYLAIPSNHPKADKQTLRLSDFTDETYITLSPDVSNDVVARLTESCSEAGFSPNLKFAPSLRTLALWVEAGLGISALDKGCFLYNNPRIKFLSLPEIHTMNSLIAWNKDHLTDLSAAFLNIVLSNGSSNEITTIKN